MCWWFLKRTLYKLAQEGTIPGHKVESLDLLWIKDESLKASASLPDPDVVVAAEVVEYPQDALEQFTRIAAALTSGHRSGT